MPSNSQIALRRSMVEVVDLLSCARPGAMKLAQQKALGRAAIVLITSHMERYLRAVNEELVDCLVASNVIGEVLPEGIRLLHSKVPIEEIEPVQWDNRSGKLVDFVETDAWLWSAGNSGQLKHRRLLSWMKSPKPASLVRYYKYWGIEDIFKAITRKSATRSDLWFRIKEVVDKRNNIAHGDASASATFSDVRKYIVAVTSLCDRADRILAKAVATRLKIAKPW